VRAVAGLLGGMADRQFPVQFTYNNDIPEYQSTDPARQSFVPLKFVRQLTLHFENFSILSTLLIRFISTLSTPRLGVLVFVQLIPHKLYFT